MKKIMIKCFQTPRGNYFYDRFLNSVVAVNDNEYLELQDIEKSGQLPPVNSLKRFTDNELLHETILEKIEHPETINFKYLSENCMQDLILQVTQQCNLRCRYCAYSGNYHNRVHTTKRMSLHTAQSAIKFYLERSLEVPELCLSFYGGEPLLEFELITKCVKFILENKGDQPVRFNMTTNGTLLTKDVIKFLVYNKFNLMISLDGPKEIHDANRRLSSDAGSFDLVMRNIKMLKEYDETYYEEKVMYNSVISAKTDMDSTYKFFSNSQLFYPQTIHFSYVNLTDIKDDSITKISTKNQNLEEFEYLKMLLSLIGRRKWDFKGRMLRGKASDIELLYNQLHRHAPEGRTMHHSGPCLVGVRRLFVDTNGTFFPCERVSENDSQMNIGSLEQGFDYKKMDLFLNHGKLIEKECADCWNLRECLFCLGSIDKYDQKITKNMLLNQCQTSKHRTEMLLQQVCILAELGYQGNENLKILK